MIQFSKQSVISLLIVITLSGMVGGVSCEKDTPNEQRNH